jgi:hypothetical protein
MRTLWRLSLTTIMAVLIIGLGPAANAVDVGAGGDRYSGSSGVILPGGVDSGTRHEAAECANCRWRLSDPCAADGGPCLAVTRGCAQLASLVRILLSSDGGATWSDRGLVCIPPSGPVTVNDVSAALHQEFERLIPALQPRYEPASGVVTRIPVNFITGQPRGLAPSAHSILGQSVVLRPSVRWSWDFGDGARQEASEPGAPYPAGVLRHAYRQSGSRVARVLTHWSGTFEVDGLGPFPVAGGIEQAASMEVLVGEGRAVLVP